MPSAPAPDWARSDVDIAVPRPADRVPGVRMAGFRQRVPVPWDVTMIAHPSVTLLVDLSAGEGAVYAAHGRERRGSVVAGLLPGELRAYGRARVEYLQIRLAPAVAAAVLGATTELTGAVVALEDIWGRDAVRAEDRLRATTSWDERFLIAAELLRRPPARRVDAQVAYAWHRTFTSRGRLRVDGLAAEVGWGREHLWSRFRDQLGISPKRAARLVRFDHAAHLLAAGHRPASVASATGHTDQSHLNREVNAFAGLTPAAVATAPWLAVDDIAWPGSVPARAR